MPVDSGGNVTRPAAPLPVSGQSADAPQVNVPINDIYAVLNMIPFLDGRKSMRGNIPMNGYRVRDMRDGETDDDAATVGQVAEVFGAQVNGATAKDTPVDADFLPLYDSAAANVVRRLSWAGVKAALKAYFDTVYPSIAATVLKAGATMTGKLTLDGNPSSALHAAPKQYVDTTAAAAAAAVAVGVGQTWQDMTASRVPGSSYQNTTGRPIQVSIWGDAAGSSVFFDVSANGSSWVAVGFFQELGTKTDTVSVVVPSNHYYRVRTANLGFYTWVELR